MAGHGKLFLSACGGGKVCSHILSGRQHRQAGKLPSFLDLVPLLLVSGLIFGLIVLAQLKYGRHPYAQYNIAFRQGQPVASGRAGTGRPGAACHLSADYRLNRLLAFLDPVDPLKYQHSIPYALGSGGLFGLGLAQSRQKYLYLPAQTVLSSQ